MRFPSPPSNQRPTRREVAKLVRTARKLPLRRDMVTVLTYVRDNKVVGTRSTGNMPLKAIREVTARFVDPPELDTTIGDRVHKLRTEFDVWPLFFLHILAHVGELVNIAPGKRWRLTTEGTEYLGGDPLSQVGHLLAIWWFRTNWLVAFPFEGLGDSLPRDFRLITLLQLDSVSTKKRVDFAPFADDLVQRGKLKWKGRSRKYEQMLLHRAVEQMVIDMLATFAMAECEYGPPSATGFQNLVAFRITLFGQYLLSFLQMMRS